MSKLNTKYTLENQAGVRKITVLNFCQSIGKSNPSLYSV